MDEPPDPPPDRDAPRVILRGSTITALLFSALVLYGLYRLLAHLWR